MMSTQTFTDGQNVIVDGTLYTFRHFATAQGVPPRKPPGANAPAHCAYAVVNLPGSNHPILVRRESLKSPADTVPTRPSVSSNAGWPSSTIAAAKRAPCGLDIIKADALDAQAERLEGYAKSLRTEAAMLRGGGTVASAAK